ncbi:MAG: GGDEF domain-containing protein [Proteobacteria bacterium]|nr:GGDEF domain-containing protein [Pseudomonadota bacterium]
MTEKEDNAQKVNEIFRLTISLMGKHGVTPTPNNYKVWYEYASGNPRLCEVINGMIENGRPITKTVNDRLYTDYVESINLPFYQKLEEGIGRILSEMVDGITATGKEVTERGKKIATISKQVSSSDNNEKIRNFASSILSETKAIVESSEQFKTRLENTSEEVAALKKELATVKEKAVTDPLTGLANRRALENELKDKIKQVSETNQSLCLLMADIDHFKKINDTHGHLVGDRVLTITSTMMKEQVKGKDVVARYGGEEFVLLLPDTPLVGAMIVAEKIRTNLESLQLQVKKNQAKESIGKITISIGVAKYIPNESMEDLIARADKCLYHSKNNGRNQVTSENML